MFLKVLSVIENLHMTIMSNYRLNNVSVLSINFDVTKYLLHDEQMRRFLYNLYNTTCQRIRQLYRTVVLVYTNAKPYHVHKRFSVPVLTYECT